MQTRKYKKAQHIMEFMVVFEVFVVAAVILVSVLGLLPKLGSGFMLRSSKEVLSVGPVGLVEHSVDACGGYKIILRNNNPFPITLREVVLGEEKVFSHQLLIPSGNAGTIEGSTGYQRQKGEVYAMPLHIYYTNDDTGAMNDYLFEDLLYGTYSAPNPMGSKVALSQRILEDYCFIDGSMKSHVNGRSTMDLEGEEAYLPLQEDYSALVFDGEENYGNLGPVFTNSLPSLTVSMIIRPTLTSGETAIIYKPNSFSLTAEGDVVHFTVFDKGSPVTLSTQILKDQKWHMIDAVYDGKRLMVYLNGTLQGDIPHAGAVDGSSYDTLVSEMTPGSKRHLGFALSHLLIAVRPIEEQDVRVRAQARTAFYS